MTWVVHGSMEYRIELAGAERDARPVPLLFAEQLLKQWAHDPFTLRALARVDEALGGAGPVGSNALARREHRRWLLRRLGDALSLGRIRITEIERPTIPPDQPPRPRPPPPKPEEEVRLTWVGFALVDRSGAPLVGQRFRMRLSDGSTREGVTDAHGGASFDQIPSGACQLEFLKLDEIAAQLA